MVDTYPRIAVPFSSGQIALEPPRTGGPDVCDADYEGSADCDFTARTVYCINNNCTDAKTCIFSTKNGAKCSRTALYDVVSRPEQLHARTYCKQHANLKLKEVQATKPSVAQKPVAPLGQQQYVSVEETWIRENGHVELFNNFQARLRISPDPIPQAQVAPVGADVFNNFKTSSFKLPTRK